MNNLSTKNIKLIPDDNLRQFLLLCGLAIVMFSIRTVPNYHLIFTDWPGPYGNYVNFSADDAIYHLRLVNNTIHHFPWRVFFDPFTHAPYGNQIHFGPLFTLIISGTSLLIGWGNPSQNLIHLVAAYTPVIMGILLIFPVYWIAHNLWGKTAAILAIFILAFLPGEFLQRTSIGFADHHAAETLFSTLACAFLINALKNLHNNRKLLQQGTLAGLAMGLFVLTWPAALMFSGVFLIFFIWQLINDHFNNRPTFYLLLLALSIYLIPTIMVLPYVLINPRFDLGYYSLTQPLLQLIMLAIFILYFVVHLKCKKHHLTKKLYPFIILAIFFVIGFSIYFFLPKLFLLMQDGIKLLFAPNPGMQTVSEVRSALIDRSSNHYTIMRLWYTYFWALLFAAVGFIHLGYRLARKITPIELLFFIWTLFTIIATFAQCRFNYYLAINMALLAGGYCFYPGLNFLLDIKAKKPS